MIWMLEVGKKSAEAFMQVLRETFIVAFTQPKVFICFLEIVLSASECTQGCKGGVETWDALSSGFPMFCDPWLLSASWCFTDFWHSTCNYICDSCLCSRAHHPWAEGLSGRYLPCFGMKTTPRVHMPVLICIIWAGHHSLFSSDILHSAVLKFLVFSTGAYKDFSTKCNGFHLSFQSGHNCDPLLLKCLNSVLYAKYTIIHNNKSAISAFFG